jgi:hypothetical protein
VADVVTDLVTNPIASAASAHDRLEPRSRARHDLIRVEKVTVISTFLNANGRRVDRFGDSVLAALLIGSGQASALGVLAGGDVRRAADTRMVPAR